MNINITKVLSVYKSINTIQNEPMSYRNAHALLIAKRELEPHVQFYISQERKLIEECGVKGEDGKVIFNGDRFSIEAGKLDEYRSKHNELDNVEIDIDLKETKINPIENISMAVLEALSTIFEFEEV